MNWIRYTAWLLIFVLAGTALAQPPSPDPLHTYKVGTKIKVATNDGRKLEGTLESREATGFHLRTDNQGSLVIAYADTRSVQKKSNKGKWIAIGVLTGVGIAAIAIGLVFKARFDNE